MPNHLDQAANLFRTATSLNFGYGLLQPSDPTEERSSLFWGLGMVAFSILLGIWNANKFAVIFPVFNLGFSLFVFHHLSANNAATSGSRLGFSLLQRSLFGGLRGRVMGFGHVSDTVNPCPS
jgi:hypothetical protein